MHPGRFFPKQFRAGKKLDYEKSVNDEEICCSRGFPWPPRKELGGFSRIKESAPIERGGYNLVNYFLIVISTRRFFWRPSGSSAPLGFLFDAIGFEAPRPWVRMLPDLIP